MKTKIKKQTKKLLSVLLSLCMLLSVAVSVPLSAFADENTKQTAITITTGNSISETFEYVSSADYDTTKWYKFKAPSNGWYEFVVGNPYLYDNDGYTYIDTYNEEGDVLDFNYVDDFTGKCAAYINCSSGSTYYFEVDIYAGTYEDKSWTTDITIKKTFAQL